MNFGSCWGNCRKFFLILICLSKISNVYSEYNQNTSLVLTNVSDSGMFATFFSVLGALDFYEKENYAGLKVEFTTGRYLDPDVGSNWWDYFFEPINLGKESESKHYFTVDDCLNLVGIAFNHTIERSYYLFQRYIHLKPNIQYELDAFISKHFKTHFVIGVHHRGTDKILEHPLVPYERTYQAVCQVIDTLSSKQKKNLRIFIATDDQNFLEFMSQRFPSIVIYNDCARSSNTTPLHDYVSNLYPNKYQMGKGAVLDCYLLSSCNILIRPKSSCLSWVSTLVNPSLRVINLK